MTASQQRARPHLPRIGTLGWTALLSSLLLILAACGDDDSETATATTEPSVAAETTEAAEVASAAAEEADPTQEAETEAAEAVATAAASEAEDGAEASAEDGASDEVSDTLADLASDTGSATVTIGDTSYEFSLAGTLSVDGTTYVGRCQSLFGMIAGSGFAADGRDITVDMEIPPVDWETYEDDRYDAPSIEVEDNVGNAKWVADVSVEYLTGSGVGEYEQEETTASGAATFANEWAPDTDPVEGTFTVDCGA